MATLTNEDFQDIRQRVYADATYRASFKAWGLSKAQYEAALQGAETWFVGAFTTTPSTSFKAAIEAAIGTTCTNAQAKLIGFAWMGWRFGANP